MKKLQTILLLLSLIVVWSVYGLFVSAEPVISTDVALMQMSDTTEGHLASRTYMQRFQPLITTGIIPWLVSLVVFAMIAQIWGNAYIKKLFEKEKKNEDV